MPTSRKRTWMAERTSEQDSANAPITITIGTTIASPAVSGTRYQIARPSSTVDPISKSTAAATTYDIGRSSRGKYTLVMSDALLTRLPVPLETAPEKNVHGNRPEYANSAYGTPSLGMRASRVNTTVNTSIIATGCRIAH